MTAIFLEGKSYLQPTQTPVEAFSLLQDSFKKKPLMVISRSSDEEVKNYFSNKDMTTVWLTNVPTDRTHLRPQEIEQLCYDVEQFMKQHKDAVVLFSAVEYLISYSTFKEVFHLLQNLRDFALMNNTIFILNIGSGTLESQQEKLFLQEFILLEEK